MILLILFTFLSKCVAQVPADNPSQSSSPESLTQDPNHPPVLPTPWVEDGVTHQDVYKLGVKGQYANIPLRTDGYDHLSTFCYSSVPLSISLFWSSASMEMDLPSNDYRVYMGPNVTSVVSLVQASESAWFYSQLPWRSKDFKLSPFENACLGVQTNKEYTLTLQWKHVNYIMVAVTLSGIALFWMAPTHLLPLYYWDKLGTCYVHSFDHLPGTEKVQSVPVLLGGGGLQPLGVPDHQHLVQHQGVHD